MANTLSPLCALLLQVVRHFYSFKIQIFYLANSFCECIHTNIYKKKKNRNSERDFQACSLNAMHVVHLKPLRFYAKCGLEYYLLLVEKPKNIQHF